VVPTKGHIAIAIPSGSVVKALARARSPRRTSSGAALFRAHGLTPPPPQGSLKGVAGVDWSKVHVFFCNERDGGKTYSGDLDDFINVVGIPLANCHAVSGLDNGGDPKKAAAAYEQLLLTSPVISQVNGGPAFDWIGLGTGDDGHCASINPGTDEAKANIKTSAWVLPIAPNASNPKAGITVSLRLLNNAARVSISAGEKKRAPMVLRALTNVYEPYGCPAGEVMSTLKGLPGIPKTYVSWYCDVDSYEAYRTKPASSW
jgi:6-phosphogluconolactonase/glucosamine-6-phosphate isomerase/deaminase